MLKASEARAIANNHVASHLEWRIEKNIDRVARCGKNKLCLYYGTELDANLITEEEVNAAIDKLQFYGYEVTADKPNGYLYIYW